MSFADPEKNFKGGGSDGYMSLLGGGSEAFFGNFIK